MGPERGQASVELVASVPLVLAIGAIAWQLALAGHTAWMASHAARAGARADAVGQNPRAAARSAVPQGLRRGLAVRRRLGGGLSVRMRVPVLVYRWRSAVTVGGTASLGRARR